MKSIVNKTTQALRVPLPKGKVLHLGPLKSGHIGDSDDDHPPLKALIDEKKVEIFDADGNEAIPEAGRHGKAPFES